MGAIFYIKQGILEIAGAQWAAFSGHGAGYNNPLACDQKGVGPLPPGSYAVGPLQASHGSLGPFVMALTQQSGETFGRGSFYIHGAGAVHPELSSDGCLILPRAARIALDKALGNDRTLQVVASR